MDKTTMTIDAMNTSRVRFACLEAGQTLLAANRDRAQGTTVSSPVVPVIADARAFQAPTYVGGGFGSTTKDLEFHPFGEPPV
jgi:hypothetical protein